MKKVVAIVPAAGFGKRIGNKTNKQFLKINNIPIVIYTMRKIADIDEISEIYPVIRKDEINFFKNEILTKYPVNKIKNIIIGGRERQDSVFNALKIIKNAEIIIIHDGVRPFFDKKTFKEAIENVETYEAVAIGIPTVDTLKKVSNGFYIKTLDRKSIYQIQTPQIFKANLIKKAYHYVKEHNISITDDTQAVELIGKKIKIIEGSRYNFKITTKEDLEIANFLASKIKKFT